MQARRCYSEVGHRGITALLCETHTHTQRWCCCSVKLRCASSQKAGVSPLLVIWTWCERDHMSDGAMSLHAQSYPIFLSRSAWLTCIRTFTFLFLFDCFCSNDQMRVTGIRSGHDDLKQRWLTRVFLLSGGCFSAHISALVCRFSLARLIPVWFIKCILCYCILQFKCFFS